MSMWYSAECQTPETTPESPERFLRLTFWARPIGEAYDAVVAVPVARRVVRHKMEVLLPAGLALGRGRFASHAHAVTEHRPTCRYKHAPSEADGRGAREGHAPVG